MSSVGLKGCYSLLISGTIIGDTQEGTYNRGWSFRMLWCSDVVQVSDFRFGD